MTILDRYIARQFLFNAVALLVLLFTFIVAIDVTLNIDRFVARAKELSAQTAAVPELAGEPAPGNGGPGQPAAPSGVRLTLLTTVLVFNLWGPKLLQLFTYTVGLALVGAMGFTLTQMVRHRELVAMMASGISLRRVARPIMIVAAGFMLLKLADHELLLSNPRIAPLLVRDHGDAGNPRLTRFSIAPTAEAPNPVTGERRVFMAADFDPDAQTIEGLDVWERDARGVATRRVSAHRAVWTLRDGKTGWDLAGVEVKSLKLPPAGSTRAVVDPGPAPDRIETDLGPDAFVFRRHATYAQNLSWAQISSMLENPNIEPAMQERLQRIRWGRLATIVSGLLSLAITLPFFLLREPKNMLVQSLKCAPVGIVAVLGSVLLSAMTVPGLPPGFSAMLPVFVLIPIAIASTSWVKT